MVSEPPFSMLRAAPKNFLGGYSAAESTPPERMRPDAGAERLYARPRRVMESSRTTTSMPISTRRLARSIASSATVVWSSAGRSKVEAMTSPLTVRCMSVTSSGRSSTSTIMRCTSGLLVVIALAIDCSMRVLPALGGETIRPRWPLPIGATRSTTRGPIFLGSVSRRSRSCGYSGTSLLNSTRSLFSSGVRPLTEVSWTRAENFWRELLCCSPSRGARMAPTTASPLRRLFFLTWDRLTYTSDGPGR